MKKIAILVLAHKPLDYILEVASKNPDVCFFVHYDKKNNIGLDAVIPKNLFYINSRVDVKWGGFSQVQAIINLFEFSLENSDAEFFHLISGEDVILSSNKLLSSNLSWNTEEIFIDMIESKRHQYRVRFYAPHVETSWQRKLSGKFLTFVLKVLDKIFYTKKKYWFGSNWFSIKRSEISKILNCITSDDIEFFKKRLNPDEHFFQYMVEKCNLLHKVSSLGNKRYIIFDKKYNNGNNPVYLNSEYLMDVFLLKKHFFSRKVDKEVQFEFYEKVNQE